MAKITHLKIDLDKGKYLKKKLKKDDNVHAAPLNSYSEEEKRAIKLRKLGVKLTTAPLAEAEGFTLASLEDAFKAKKIAVGYYKDLKSRLKKLQKSIDRENKRKN